MNRGTQRPDGQTRTPEDTPADRRRRASLAQARFALLTALPPALLHWLTLSVTLFVGLSGCAVGWIYWGSWRYVQQDDPAHVASKRAYLAEVTRMATPAKAAAAPNIVVILFDDLGYGDLGAYGARSIATPRLDRFAAEGVRLTNYYAPAPLCSPSRAGLLTGRYPIRTRLTQVPMTAGGSIGAPLSWLPLYELQRAAGVPTRLPLEEITLAEVLRAAGYATAIFGKWHLGSSSPSLPNDRGFDTFEGLLSSNDQLPNPLYHNREVIEPSPVDQTRLTERYTRGALDFIAAHHTQPFFLYLPHTFPHRPLHPSEAQRGHSAAGLYGDVVEDLDRSTGRILDALHRWHIDRHTIVFVTSDNGPWFQGSPGLHRGRKTDLFDGGFSVPFMARWPGTLPAGAVRSSPAMGIDIFPSLLALVGIPLPPDRIIDGRDMLPLLRDGSAAPHRALYFYWSRTLGAVRDGRFKYHIRRPILAGYGLAPITIQIPLGPWLFDLHLDPDESYDVGDRYPGKRARLAELLLERQRADTEDPRGFLQVKRPR